MIAEIERLSISERIQLVEDIWDSIATSPESLPVTPAQRAELDRRLESYRSSPQEGVSWETVQAIKSR